MWCSPAASAIVAVVGVVTGCKLMDGECSARAVNAVQPFKMLLSGYRISMLGAPARPAQSSAAFLQPARQHACVAPCRLARRSSCVAKAATAEAPQPRAPLQPESQVPGMTAFLDSLKWDKDGLVAVVVQHVDTGEVLMQAFADRAAISETLQTGLGTFYSRSRKSRWCKGETSGNFLQVLRVYTDCDRDSLIYLTDPIGPACHTGARTCWFTEAGLQPGGVTEAGSPQHTRHANTTLLALEQTIQERKQAMDNPQPGEKPSWTARLLSNPELLCKKVREEAGELCQTLEANEGKERAASEMADLLYHSMVLLNLQGVPMEDVMRVLRKRFGTSGVEEKAARPPKPAA